MTAEQRARAWEMAATLILDTGMPMADEEMCAYIEGKLIPAMHAKAKALRRKLDSKRHLKKTTNTRA
jgi:hypothetical protein